MFEHYRYISARSLLKLEKLDRCQDLPVWAWTPAAQLWHLVFISHRWSAMDDPDPISNQLRCLQRLVQRMLDVAVVIEDDRADEKAVRERLARIPSLAQQGSLQAAHLVFRTLSSGFDMEVPEQEASNQLAGDGILDLIGFWYDFSCLPQDPKSDEEEREFRGALQGIGKMILSPRVSTLLLRQEDDGYLERGWCFAESMIAGAKEDVYKPMILRTDRWGETLALPLEVNNVALRETITAILAQWADVGNPVSAWTAFENIVTGSAILLLGKLDSSMSEFVVAATGSMAMGIGLFAGVMSRLAMLPVGGCLDLAGELVQVLRGLGLGCRDERDYVTVALLLLRSLTAVDAEGDLKICWSALDRHTVGLALVVERCQAGLVWQDASLNGLVDGGLGKSHGDR
jgi:hypothetical protein